MKEPTGFRYAHLSISMKYTSFENYRWLDKLGVAVKEGMGVVMRQTFYGWNYAPIDNSSMPSPVSKH